MNSMIMDFQKKQTQKLETPEMTAVMAAVNALVDHAAILAKNGGRDFLPDLPRHIDEMILQPDQDIFFSALAQLRRAAVAPGIGYRFVTSGPVLGGGMCCG